MLANQLITNNYPIVHPDDHISLALQLMDDFDIQHIAVVDENKYIGLISKDDLLDGHENAPVKSAMEDVLQKAVKADEHFLSALRFASTHSLSLVPVVSSEQEWLGA